MIRRSIAGMILGISLLLASLAWSGFVALRTVLDPGHSERIADKLYDDDAVRDQLARNISGALGALVPEGFDVPQSTLDEISSAALDDPRVESLVFDAFVATHAAFLGEGEMPTTLDAGVLGQAARDAMVQRQPELDAVLPAAPELEVALPTERIPDLGPLRRALMAVVPILAVLAAGGIALAFVTTSHRPSVLRRAGLWAIGASAFILAGGLGLPWLIRRFAPEQAEVAAVLLATLVESTLVPALVLAGAGLVFLVLAAAWPRGAPRHRGGDRPPRAHRRPPERHGPPAAPRPPAPARTPAPARPREASPTLRPQGPPTRPQPVIPTTPDPRPPPLRQPAPPPARPEQPDVTPAPRWIPGVGYVDDDDHRQTDRRE